MSGYLATVHGVVSIDSCISYDDTFLNVKILSPLFCREEMIRHHYILLLSLHLLQAANGIWLICTLIARFSALTSTIVVKICL